jgi:tetratricopeptide (TPR) repeat protein
MDDLRVSEASPQENRILIAWLSEEEWSVTSFLDLLLCIFQALQEEFNNSKGAQPCAPKDRVESLYEMPVDAAESEGAALLKEFIDNSPNTCGDVPPERLYDSRTLLLLVENLDDLFAGLGKDGQKQLRTFLEENSCIVLATAQSYFKDVKQKNSPFYGFFCHEELKELKADDATQLLANIAKHNKNDELASFIQTQTGRDRIKAVHFLAGGNHRLYVIFSEFLTDQKSLDQLVDAFMRTLDDLTPYYQERMRFLSPQQRKIIDFLCDRRHPVPVKEIAQRCFMTHQTASSQLKKLLEMGYVRSEPIGRESFYELREPLMRFCLEVKKQRGQPIRLFVDFLRLWYTRTELQQRLQLRVAEIRKAWLSDGSAKELSVALIDELPQEQNHSKHQQPLELLPPDAVLEREYLLYALQAIEEDDEDPRVVAYWQEYEDFCQKKDYVSAWQQAKKLVTLRGHAQDWLAQGSCLASLKRYEEALASFKEAIALDPNSVNAWLSQGAALYYLQRYDEALVSFDRVVKLNPNYANAWFGRWELLKHLKRYEEALVSFDKGLELGSINNAWVWDQQGNVLSKLQRYEEALVSFDKAIKLDPNYVWAWGCRGHVLDNLKRNEEALVSFDKAIELDPNYVWAWGQRGLVLGKLQRYEEALASFDKAIELDPNYVWAWANRGLVLGKLQRYKEALASYDKAIKLDPNYTGAWGCRGLVLDNLQRYEEALASYNKAIELDPNYAGAWGCRGLVLDNLQRYKEALASYNKAIELDPNYPWDWGQRGDMLNNLKRYEEALASFDKAIELDPNYAWVWGKQGDVLDKLERYQEALASFDKAIELDPNYAWAWSKRGDVLDQLERYQEALASYDKAIELIPNYAWAWANRGWSLNQLERYEEALASLEKAIELDPNYAWAWGERGNVLDKLERYEEALASYDKAIELDPNYAWAWANRAWSLNQLERYQEALASYDKAIEIDSNDPWTWGNRALVLENLGRYEEALGACDKAIELGEEEPYVFFDCVKYFLVLNQWDKGIAALDNALNRFAHADEPNTGDTVTVICNLFNSTKDAALWRSRIKTLIELYDKYQVLSALGQGLVRSIPALRSEMISDKAAQTWLEVWRELTGSIAEFQIPLRLVNTAVRSRETKGDTRVLLELPIEERNLLKTLLDISEGEQ